MNMYRCQRSLVSEVNKMQLRVCVDTLDTSEVLLFSNNTPVQSWLDFLLWPVLFHQESL